MSNALASAVKGVGANVPTGNPFSCAVQKCPASGPPVYEKCGVEPRAKTGF